MDEKGKAVANLQPVPKESALEESTETISPGVVRALQWAGGTLLVFALGSWLVWFAMYLQHRFVAEEIRAACQRVMPDTVQRCVDTVIIQRGGARR